MQIRFNEDSVIIEGYVNAIERMSKPLQSRLGKFAERIKKGAFKRAIEKNDNIRCLLNHDWNKDLGGTKDGNIELVEDSIGLKARATITDKEVIEKARRGDLVGWSFGFTDNDVDTHDENGLIVRDVKDLNLFEISLLDRTKAPAYEGTLVTVRSDDEIQYRGEPLFSDVEIREDEPKEEPEQNEPKQHESVDIDYSKYDKLIQEMREDY